MSIENRLDALETLVIVAFSAQAMTVAADPFEELELLYKAAFRQLVRRFRGAESEEDQEKVLNALAELEKLKRRLDAFMSQP